VARFLKHIPCSNCGSRNNRGVYDDGSEWCFGCHDSTKASMSPLVARAKHGRQSGGNTNPDCKPLPSDASVHFGKPALDWLSKYDIPIETLIKEGVRWSEEWQQLLFTFGTFWQARNFRPGKSKYFTSGPHDDLLPIYFSPGDVQKRTLVITEDCLSAIKTAYATALNGLQMHAMPLLGSHLPSVKLNRLARLYNQAIVWLDHDKGKEAQQIVARCRAVGMTANVVITQHDPKDYTNEEILQILTEKA